MELNQPIDLIAKLLANENINVIRTNTSTASFDIKERTLRLPTWKMITDEIDQMLVAHEVGHALYTTDEYTEALYGDLDFSGAKSYLNILEDARVEKLIKRTYPGTRKTFTVGYKQLNDMDFFGIAKRDIQDLSLIDRINMYFKVGYSSGVSFSSEEKPFVVRAEQTETIGDVIQLAKDIWTFCQNKKQERENHHDDDDTLDGPDDGDSSIDDDDFNDEPNSSGDNVPAEDTDGDQDDDQWDDDFDQDGEEVDDSEDDDNEIGDEQGEQKDNPTDSDNTDTGDGITDRTFARQIAELSDTDTEYKYWKIEPPKYDPIISYKHVLTQSMVHYVPELDGYQSFRNDTQNNVDYMIKEFHMKKAASEYKRTQISKIGSLDTRKLWSYQINDDIFKRTAIVKTGKNHGMIFLLDWSSSMHSAMTNTIKQVISLVMFCRQAQIPFQVLAFTDLMYSSRAREMYSQIAHSLVKQDGVIDMTGKKLSLLELFSSDMTANEFRTMSALLLSKRVEQTFHLNGTPLLESLSYMYKYIASFQSANNVEKVSLITLTDGEAIALDCNITTRVFRDGQRINRRNFIRDEVTKKSLEVDAYVATQTNALLTLIKNKYNCTIVGFHLVNNRRRPLVDFISSHYSIPYGEYDRMIDRLRSEFKSVGYGSAKGTGRDDLFIIPIESSGISTEELSLDKKDSARNVAKKFTKYMLKQKTSRYLLNKFIGYVA